MMDWPASREFPQAAVYRTRGFHAMGPARRVMQILHARAINGLPGSG